MSAIDFTALSRALGRPESLITDLAGYESYCQDATEESGRPAALVLAESVEDVQATVRFAGVARLAVVARGAGTGLSGGAVPSEGSLLISVERMKALSVDPARQMAICGPGVITKELLDAAEHHGLTYPPDPASYLECSLGGNVAENAGGLRCKRYGVTRDYVIGMRAVMADGELLDTGIFNGNRGFNLGDLLIGSEGTLAIITEIAVRLIPAPTAGATILVAFNDPEDAAKSVAQITAAGIIPTVMEYLDGDAADCSNHYEKYDGLDKAGAILLIETSDNGKNKQIDHIQSICRDNSCSYLRCADDPEKAEDLWRIRRNLSKAIRDMARMRFNEDVSVPISQFSTLIAFVAELNRSGPLRINAFGHAGDGNLHVSFLSMTGDPEEVELIAAGVTKLYRRTLELGGSLSGEHGIGRHKGKYLPWEFAPPTLAFMEKIKDTLDPVRLLNPDKIFIN